MERMQKVRVRLWIVIKRLLLVLAGQSNLDNWTSALDREPPSAYLLHPRQQKCQTRLPLVSGSRSPSLKIAHRPVAERV